jgi:hypothetical protein
MDVRDATPLAQRVPPDILLAVFSLVADEERPRLCSCPDHGPAERKTEFCCRRRDHCIHESYSHDVPAARPRLPSPNGCVHDLGWVVLGHVCRHWRNVLLDMRSLWADNVCVLNNAAMYAFIQRAQRKSLTLDYDTAISQHMRRKGSRDARLKLLRANASRARIIRVQAFEGDLAHLETTALPFLEVLELSTKRSIVINAPNLRETISDGAIVLHAPNIIRASLFTTTSVLHAPSIRVLELAWQTSQCLEIPLLLITLPCLEELAIHLQGWPSDEDVDQDFLSTNGNQDGLRSRLTRNSSLSIPTLTRLRVSGHGAVHRYMCGLLNHLVTSPKSNVRRLDVQCGHPKFTESGLAIDAFRSSIHALKADSVYLHIIYGNAITLSISASRQEDKHDAGLCRWTTYKVDLSSRDDLEMKVKTLLRRLLPLDLITHLHIECIPLRGLSTPVLIALGAAFSELTSVHTLWVNDNARGPPPPEAIAGLYVLVGPQLARSLPSLETLNISYTQAIFRDWWKRLAAALTARDRVGLPLTTVRIIHNWGKNVRRPAGAVRTPLETFHEQPDVDLEEPDIFVDKAPPEAFFVDKSMVWAKEKVADVARSLFAQIVETIEVEEAPAGKLVWPPKYETPYTHYPYSKRERHLSIRD